jgi:hypothetical protein
MPIREKFLMITSKSQSATTVFPDFDFFMTAFAVKTFVRVLDGIEVTYSSLTWT